MIATATMAATLTWQLVWPSGVTVPPETSFHAIRADGAPQTVTGSGDLDLPPGHWFVRAAAPGFWSEESLVHVRDGQPAGGLRFVLEHATTVTGEVIIAGGAQPTEAVAHFQDPVDGRSRSTRCPILDGHLTCTIPVGAWDLAFRVHGFASVYRWDVNLVPPGVDLGRLTFRPGSTLSGRVANPLRLTQVVVTPASGDGAEDGRPRANLHAKVIDADRRGRFVAHLEPGQYRIHARSETLRSEEQEVSVLHGREAALLRPLVLESPRAVTVVVRPRRDPWQRPWRVVAGRRTAETDDTGAAALELHSGTYRIQVRSGDSIWFTTEAKIESDQTIDVDIAEVILRGNITVGDEPLASAWITFVEEKTKVIARSSSSGTYGVRLPKNAGDVWPRVEIKADGLATVLENVHATRLEGGELRLDIELPRTRLAGKVVTGGGEPADALVTIQGAGGLFTQLQTTSGRFEVRALPRGPYEITAAGPRGNTTAPYPLVLDEDADITVELSAAPHFRGTVVSPFGPVAGATIHATRTGESPRFIAPLKTDATGAFDIRLSPGSSELTVLAHAPGYALRLFRMALGTEPVQIPLTPQGGTLRLRSDPGRFLMHDSSAIPMHVLMYLAGGRIEGRWLEIPIAEEGTYALCPSVVVDARCRTAFLARHGSVSLED